MNQVWICLPHTRIWDSPKSDPDWHGMISSLWPWTWGMTWGRVECGDESLGLSDSLLVLAWIYLLSMVIDPSWQQMVPSWDRLLRGWSLSSRWLMNREGEESVIYFNLTFCPNTKSFTQQHSLNSSFLKHCAFGFCIITLIVFCPAILASAVSIFWSLLIQY